MPNTCCTPDSVIAVVPENSTEDLRYPILICEVLGKKKSNGTNEEKFDGFNTTMQSLVFAPRAYYCEIIESDERMFLLKKVPEKGYLSIDTITYQLYERHDFQCLVGDICRGLINALVNLTPIAQYSAKCLRSASYRDFLNVPSTHSNKIEPHCWHLFVPKFLNQDRAEVPGDFLAGIDLEDPSQPDPVSNLTAASIIRIRDAVSNTLPVNESNIDLEAIVDMNARLDLSIIQAVRAEEGKPVSYEEVKTAVKAVSLNFGVDAGIKRVKEFVQCYGPSGVGFLGGEGEEEYKRHSIIQVSSEENPLDTTIQSAYDIEMDEDDTIISGGGELRDNVIVFDTEGKIKIIRRKRGIAAPRKERRKIRVTMGEEDFKIMSAAARAIMKTHTPKEPGAVPGTLKQQNNGGRDPGQPDPQPAPQPGKPRSSRKRRRIPAGREAKYLEDNPLQETRLRKRKQDD